MDSKLQQFWEMPTNAKPIIVIGAGDIVNDAHMPAYKKAGFSVAGVFDIDNGKALKLADKWGINKIFSSIWNCSYRIEPIRIFNNISNKFRNRSNTN